MKLLVVGLFVLSFSAHAEECIFNENAFFEFRNEYVRANNNASTSEDGRFLLVSRGSETIQIIGGGCNHLGVSIQSKGNTLYSEKQFLQKVQNLAEEFGEWLINIDELKNSIKQGRWEKHEGHYFIEVDVMTVFSAYSNNQGDVSVDFYIN